MKIIVLAAPILAAAANCGNYAPAVPMTCANFLATNVVIDGGDGNTLPGARYDPRTGICTPPNLNQVQLPGFLNNLKTLTVELPQGGYTGSTLLVSFDNKLEGCYLNGNLIDGSTGVDSGNCCHVNGALALTIPDSFWELDNTLVCNVRDAGGLAYFDVSVCGDVVGPLNPDEPICRQKFLADDGLLHLVSRPDFNDTMGCVSDDECIEHTSAESWCKADGTCRGCDDWEGCCSPSIPEPVPLPEFPCTVDEDCLVVGECSYCVNEYECFACEDDEPVDPEPVPEFPCTVDEDCDVVGECSYCVNEYECFACEDPEPVDPVVEPIACGLFADADGFCQQVYGDCSYCQGNGVTCKQC